MIYNKILRTTLLTASLLVLISCERDQCDPPFALRNGLFGSGLVLSEPFKSNKDVGFSIELFISSITILDDITIEINFPPEVDIKPNIIQPIDAPRVVRKGNTILWKASIKPSFGSSLLGQSTHKDFTLWLKSKTNWEKWSQPITMHISVNFRVEGRQECNNWPDGNYTRTITWSHKGYKDTNWSGPNMEGGKLISR